MKNHLKWWGSNTKNSGLEKIGEYPEPCFSPEHYPPTNIVLKPGLYKYPCPACGAVTIFTVPRITWQKIGEKEIEILERQNDIMRKALMYLSEQKGVPDAPITSMVIKGVSEFATEMLKLVS